MCGVDTSLASVETLSTVAVAFLTDTIDLSSQSVLPEMDGDADGCDVGFLVIQRSAIVDGMSVGADEGSEDGTDDGTDEGIDEGSDDGVDEGTVDGWPVGCPDGCPVGCEDG